MDKPWTFIILMFVFELIKGSLLGWIYVTVTDA